MFPAHAPACASPCRAGTQPHACIARDGAAAVLAAGALPDLAQLAQSGRPAARREAAVALANLLAGGGGGCGDAGLLAQVRRVQRATLPYPSFRFGSQS